MKTLNLFIIALALLLFANPPTLLAKDYSNSSLGFTAKLPDGLDDVSKDMRIATLVSLGNFNQKSPGPMRLVSLQDLGGAIRRDDDLSKKPFKPGMTMEKIPWKTFQIDVFRVTENVNGASLLTFNAQVPLKPHAIQVMIAGPAGDEADLRKELQAIVSSVEGPSNWLTGEERMSRISQGLGRLVGIALVVAIVVTLVVRKARS